MDRLLKLLIFLKSGLLVFAGEFSSNWSGSRTWIGPEYWASPIYDWEVKDGAVEAKMLYGRLLHLLSHRVDDPAQGGVVEAEVELPKSDHGERQAVVWAGFAVGVRGQMDDVRHVAMRPTERIDAVVRVDGRLMIGKKPSKESLPGVGKVSLKLIISKNGLELVGTRGGKSVTLKAKFPPEKLTGNLCLAASSPAGVEKPEGAFKARFRNWRASGEGLVKTEVKPFGPILWSQYTRQGKRVKLSVQMPPLGNEDAETVLLAVRKPGEEKWTRVGEAPIDPLALTALFSFDLPSDQGAWEYRSSYPWQGTSSHWDGVIRADPKEAGESLKIGVFSCDNGYAFPLPTLTRNVAVHDPHLLYFAGDQIYESFGGFKLVRTPVEKAMLDYLRKFYQFGWTWRELLKDRPSIIIPDDHDVFQGNIWGAGGRSAEEEKEGGYVMPARWVNAVQRTQTAHLPDPVDPEPIEQGITVYFTEMEWGGVPLVVLEDRKWKSSPQQVLPANRFRLPPGKLDVAEASMLGARQEKFLNAWAQKTAGEPLRLVLSQTIFCKGTTHGTPKMRKSGYDFDSNGWPQSGRRRALLPFKGDNTLMLHGDQHLGLLVRQGIDDWGDGPWAFMVPGTANGWPRAWWPEGGRILGDFQDPFENKFTVIAAANPEKGSNLMDPLKKDPPEKVAHQKGSGYGLVRISPDKVRVDLEMWRYQFDAAEPKDGDQFEGFPQTLEFGHQ